jgi:NDP-sugar pyrophosphorylase family protein
MTEELPPVCILAGGLGARLGTLVKESPKPLLEVAGAPFLVHQLRLLRTHGARRIVLCVGYLGDHIEHAVGDGNDLGLEVAYRYDQPGATGTAAAVRGALDLLPDDGFFVLYGDTYLRVDYAAVFAAFRASDRLALMTVLRNEGRWDTSNVLLDGDRVTRYDKQSPMPEMVWIDYGLSVVRADALAAVGPDATDLAAVYAALAERGELAAYLATERFYEIGTPSALAETEAFLVEHGPAA